MKKSLFFSFAFSAVLLTGFSQTYQPNWQSLDTRPIPQWYKNSKFGIFIHWGVYAVPGFAPKGNYSEWYQYALETKDSATVAYHKINFNNAPYYKFQERFTADLFNPDEWAQLFEQSGAKYIVLTSKHHDGFCLWPSKEASRDWGFPWNAVEAGPKRDLLGDLFAAVRKTSVHPGMYYSLYEWYNPLWKKDHKEYVDKHMLPQAKELLTKYQPDVFWTDGEWDESDTTWRATEFLSWAYNQSPVKNTLVTNDRWGRGIRFKHGQFFTPEYQPELDFKDHYFEESRGMGFSYGYNRNEDAWDYNSTQSLILQLADKVSRGGNFLLDIGPDEHGKIPPIMQERLLQIGDWIKANGESIYNTVRWKETEQWSAGKRDYKPVRKEGDFKAGGDYMLKITIDPEPGYAVKEVMFTYNPETNTLYGILPTYPNSKKLELKNIALPAATQVSLLGSNQKLVFATTGNGTTIQLPEYNPNSFKAPYAFVIKMEGYGR
ncbi:alpha-L-fucosidase [Foetidibacter luteolus]|uniref:alpha-L-fucosidase n=1 Tax=Foetidibacter luteolus TaxID=2608880 RepID=UPI00129AE278|nr:alpha-L-fucosidase [Foetidibacter luteolus]